MKDTLLKVYIKGPWLVKNLQVNCDYIIYIIIYYIEINDAKVSKDQRERERERVKIWN